MNSDDAPPIPRGLYEQLVTESLEEDLRQLPDTLTPKRTDLRRVEAGLGKRHYELDSCFAYRLKVAPFTNCAVPSRSNRYSRTISSENSGGNAC